MTPKLAGSWWQELLLIHLTLTIGRKSNSTRSGARTQNRKELKVGYVWLELRSVRFRLCCHSLSTARHSALSWVAHPKPKMVPAPINWEYSLYIWPHCKAHSRCIYTKIITSYLCWLRSWEHGEHGPSEPWDSDAELPGLLPGPHYRRVWGINIAFYLFFCLLP